MNVWNDVYNTGMHHSMVARSRIVIFFFLVMVLVGCSQDRHQRQVESIKDHVSDFYAYLKKDKVSLAVLENERIEARASGMETRLLQRASRVDANQRSQEWVMIKTAHEAAAENWLALARYFVVTKQFDRARGTYQRVLDSYDKKPYQSYAERARNGLLDLDRILAPTS